MRKRKMWLSMLLAASMVLSCPAYAEPDPGVQSVSEIGSESDTAEETEEPASAEETSAQQEDAAEPEAAGGTEVVRTADAETKDTAEETEKPSVSWQDHGDGKIDLALQNYTRGADVRRIQFAVWSAKNGQDDLKWYSADEDLKYQMDTKYHGDDLGEYYVHVYAEKTDGSMQFICNLTGTVAAVKRAEPVIRVEDKKGDEKVFTLTLDNYAMPVDVKTVQAAIWSDKNGQDDLKWYVLSQGADGRYTYQFKPASHKTAGVYQVHIYEERTSGAFNFLANGNLTVSEAGNGTLTVAEPDQKNGTCRVTLSDVSCPSGITQVQIPVWSAKDQSDIKWYQAEKQSDGTWQILIDIANHKNNMGLYQIHAYATTGNNTMNKVAGATVELKAEGTAVTAVKKNEKYVLETKRIMVQGGLSNVRYAVWSDENGQDDLKWFETKYLSETASAKYNLSLNGYKSYGTYQVHCYGTDKNGKLVFLGKTTFTVEKPALESMEISTDNEKGTFEITLKGLKSGSGVSQVQIPVWSKSDQSDIVWYTAEKTGEGTYQVKSSVAKHKYNTGKYNAHVYLTEKNGIMSFLKSDTFTFTKSFGGVFVEESKDQKSYPVLVKGVSIAGGVKSVRAAVWSDKGGQDDIKWYTLTGKNGEYTGTIDISNHKTQGTYQVHVYADSKAGKSEFFGNTSFTVNCAARAEVRVTGENASSGSFSVKITLPETTAPVSKVEVPVWSRSDQSDIHWYTASKQSDGSYTCTVKISNHKLNLGTYQIHVYTTFTNGIRTGAGAASHTFNPPNVLAVTKPGNGSRKIVLKNAAASVTSVRFAVWSDDKGQDDIVWYDASRQSDGSWSATVKSSNHKSSGNYQVHCYQNNAFACNTTFSFAKSEMVKDGWRYENGYKFYYSNGKKLTNLTSVIGAQGSYVAKVNRTTCTITIYANDPNSSKGYIIPVISFTCSVGLPGTPTTPGTHYTFAKYRWKELMGPSWGQYATKFTSDGIYFHSVAGTNTTSYNLNSIDYNNLGIPASHGCVRLCVRDAKWIYDNCPLGMKVIVYDSGDPGPYGKPATIKIPAGQTWDPTDPAVG